MSKIEWDKTADDMADDVTELSSKINEILADYVQGSKHKSMIVIPIMSLALGACLARVADSADRAMGTTNERDKLLKFVNKFVMEFPNHG